MPCDYKKYPKDWKDIRAEVLKRAGHKCQECGVPNKDYVWRGTCKGLAIYQTADCRVYSANNGMLLSESGLDIPEMIGDADKLTKIVLTISHTDHDLSNNGSPGDRPNLKALCQRCHLRHDADLHRANAKATNNRKKGLQSLFP